MPFKLYYRFKAFQAILIFPPNPQKKKKKTPPTHRNVKLGLLVQLLLLLVAMCVEPVHRLVDDVIVIVVIVIELVLVNDILVRVVVVFVVFFLVVLVKFALVLVSVVGIGKERGPEVLEARVVRVDDAPAARG